MKSIRYTLGPDELGLGDIQFVRGVAQDISDEMAEQALLPQRVVEFGFELVTTPAAPTWSGKKPAGPPEPTAEKE